MNAPCRVLVSAALGFVTACGGGGGTNPQVDAGPTPDARTVACAATDPRSVAPETFVGPTGLQTRMAALIDGATTSLDVQMYLFTVKDLATRIVNAKARGVAVRVILDPDEAGNQAVEPTLTSGGVAWKTASSIYAFSHAKYLVIDGKTAVIMSMNFNATAMTQERNYGMIDKDPFDVADLSTVFEQDWALANGMTPKPPDLSCTRLIISPNNANQRLLAFINGAHATLDVEALYITDTGIRNAIGAAKTRGATVRVILETPTDSAATGNADTTTYFKSLGIPVRYVDQQFYLHAKLIMADGVAFVGSQNFSPTGLTKNREMGALVFEPGPAATIKTQFESDWSVATPQ